MFEWQFHVKALKNLSKKHHPEIPGLWMQVLDAGFWTLDAGLWMLDTGLWTLDAGLWTLNPGRWTLDAEY